MNHNHEYHSNKPEIKANVVYRDGNIEITLEDEFNNAPLLDTMHEKEMHFVLYLMTWRNITTYTLKKSMKVYL